MPNGALIHENMSVLPDHLREQVTDRAVLKTLKQSCTFDNRRQGSVKIECAQCLFLAQPIHNIVTGLGEDILHCPSAGPALACSAKRPATRS
jgi:hypothetical protein